MFALHKDRHHFSELFSSPHLQSQAGPGTATPQKGVQPCPKDFGRLKPLPGCTMTLASNSPELETHLTFSIPFISSLFLHQGFKALLSVFKAIAPT